MKALDSKSSRRLVTVSRVRIPPSPPDIKTPLFIDITVLLTFLIMSMKFLAAHPDGDFNQEFKKG